MINKYFFRSNNGNDRMTGAMLVSTSKNLEAARKIAKTKFKTYGYKGRPIHCIPFATV